MRTTTRIAELNDQLRGHAGLADHVTIDNHLLGIIVVTDKVAALDRQERSMIFERIRAFDYFTPDNDPGGEHDFGYVPQSNGYEVFWQITRYPRSRKADPQQALFDMRPDMRVMAISLAEEH